MSKPNSIPGPTRLQLLRAYPRIRRDALGYLMELMEQHGDTVLIRLRHPTYILRHPDDLKHVLVTNPRNYHKTGGLTVGEHLFGQGLVSSEEPLHGKQRRIMQPMFHKHSIAAFAELMARCTEQHIAAWRPGDTIDLALEMMHLTISIVGRALFSIDLYREGCELGLAFTDAQRLITIRQRRPPLPLWVPTPLNLRYRKVLAKIEAAMTEIITTRRAMPEDARPRDLLTMLLAARFEDGSPMPEKQLRDEVVTIILAGHETVANSLNWSWYLLSENPAADARILEEWKTVLDGRMPALEDVPKLRYTEMVLAESMRLYPPAWTLARRAVKEDTLPSGLQIRPHDELIMSQYVCQRNPKFFANPLKFDPERFAPELREKIPPFAYFPFGAGPRYCIGEAFARLETAVVLPAIGQRFRLQLVPGHPIALEPLITLRPRFGLKMQLQARN